MYRKIALFTLLLLLFASVPMSNAGDSGDMPWIYYYSRERGGFLVERADGAGSRMLYELSIEDYEPIEGPGWSPSGKWFAWKVNEHSERIYVIDRDGTGIDLPLDIMFATYIGWNPSQDILLVQNIVNPGIEISLVDVESRQILFQQTFQSEIAYEWSPDGTYVLLHLRSDRIAQNLKAISMKSAAHSMEACPLSDCQNFLPRWIDDNRIIYVDTAQEFLIIENLENNTQQRILLSLENMVLLDPNSRGDYVLIVAAIEGERTAYDLWLLDVDDVTIDFMADAIRVDPYYGGRIYGLYDQYTWAPATRWSPDGNAAIIFTPQTVFLLSVANDDISIADIYPGRCEVGLWMPDSQSVVYTCDNDGIYQYFVDTRVNRRVIELEHGLQNVAPHIRDGLIAYTYILGYVVNIEDNQRFDFDMIHQRYDPLSEITAVWLVQWHPSLPWIFARSDPGLVNVLNVDGTVHRELVSCNQHKSCYGWIPEIDE